MKLNKEQKREIARRLENWARWHWGGNSRSADSRSPFPAYNLVNLFSPRDSNQNVPVLMGEGEDTDRILREMQPDHVKALIVHYLSRGTEKTRARRCKVQSVRTYYRRVERAEEVFHRLCFPRQRHESIKEMPSTLDVNSNRFAKVAVTR